VDVLRRDDLERARRATPSERLRQALQLMEDGIRLKRAALRTRFPRASDADLDARLERWLRREDP
jgi:hypothetical protein